MSDFCSVDNPYNPSARDLRDAERSARRTEPDDDDADLPREREPRDWAPKMIGTNFPILLQQLALESDSRNRYDARYRNMVRKFLVAARLASANVGPDIDEWEERYRRRQNIEAQRDRVEGNRARRAGRR